MRDLAKEVLKQARKEREGDFNIVPMSQTVQKDKNDFPHRILLENLKEVARFLNPYEKETLEFLILNGNDIYVCVYNKDSHVIKLSIKINNDVPDNFNFPYLKDLKCNYQSKSSVSFVRRHHASVKKLTFFNQGLTKIPDLSDFHKLKELDLSNNKIQSINYFGDLPNLKYIEIIKNELKSAEGFRKITGCPNIEEIYINYNQISDICGLEPFSHFENLDYLDLSYNNVKSFSITHPLKKLYEINLSNNPLESVYDFEKLPNLYHIGGKFDLNLLSNENIEYLFEYMRKNQLSYELINNFLVIKQPKDKTDKTTELLKHFKIDPRLEIGLKLRELIKAKEEKLSDLAILQKRIILVLGPDYFDQNPKWTTRDIISKLELLYSHYNIPKDFGVSLINPMNDLIKKGFVCSERFNDKYGRKKRRYYLTGIGYFLALKFVVSQHELFEK